MKKLLLSITLCFLFASFSIGQVDSNYKSTLKRMFRAERIDETYVQAIKMMLPILERNHPELNAEQKNEIEKEFLKTSIDTLVELLAPIYLKYYKQNELEEIIKFYESPIGIRLAKNTTLIMEESKQAGKEWGMRMGRDFERKIDAMKK